jgi:hypothetical protein
MSTNDDQNEREYQAHKAREAASQKQTRQGYYEWLYRRYKIWYGESEGRRMAKQQANRWPGGNDEPII